MSWTLQDVGIVFGIVVSVFGAAWKGIPPLVAWHRARNTRHHVKTLKAMLRDVPGNCAFVSSGLDRPPHVVVGENVLLKKDDEQYRLAWLEALETLEQKGFVKRTNGQCYTITAKGSRSGAGPKYGP